MGDSEHLLVQRSFYSPEAVKHLTEKCCKSDINVLRHCDVRNLQYFGDYYKKYEHDALPVRDSTCYATRASETRDRDSLTNSELEQLEMNILKNMSQELNIDNNRSHTSLESNIKLFKTTVQEIFDNFYASMKDFEIYKERFNAILAKNQNAAVADMEDFIKDMIQHIMLSESTTSNESGSNDIRMSNDSNMTNEINFSNDSKSDRSEARRESIETSIISSVIRNKASNTKTPEEVITNTTNSNLYVENFESVVEAYKNYGYTTDSTTIDDNKIEKSSYKPKEVLNIYLLSGAPCVQIKMTNRNLLSEINIKETSNTTMDGKYGASAENLKKLAAKEKELEKYVNQDQINDIGPDREIPVKVSYAKRNIHLNEDVTSERESDKSFLSKLCNYICRRFRKL